jgi:hypothetical protein
MTASPGFIQLNFQVPHAMNEKIEKEAARLGLKRGAFITRIILLYFLKKEMGFDQVNTALLEERG